MKIPKVFVLLSVIPIVLFVDPKAWVPEVFIPNWWDQPLFMILVANMSWIVLPGILAVLLVLGYEILKGLKI